MNNLLDMNKFIPFEHNYNEDSTDIVKAQKKLRGIKEGSYTESAVRRLPDKMLKSLIEAISKNAEVVPSVCNTIEDWSYSASLSIIKEDNMDILDNIKLFISELKSETDFIKAYTFKNEKIESVWIIVCSADYETSKKYMKKVREFQNIDDINECEFLIFDQEEEEEVLEQISYISRKYEVYSRNA